ncbi:MAG: BatA and WFA domain-containing protein [Lachnospiraceae bacterium]|nr:BatA and WFA domain-containing protein [Lachnospiraceae bacterium]
MNFINPLGFLALIGIPLIVLMYILKQKFQKHEVSSMMLWKKVLEQSEGQKWRQKLRRNILMFLQILSVLLVALALANPFILAQAQREDYVLVLDASLSMQATDENPTRFEKAKEDINKLIDNTPNNTMFSLVVLDDSPSVLVNRSTEKSVVKNSLMKIQPKSTGADEEALTSLLKVLEGDIGANVYVFTDKNIDTGIDGANTVVYGESDNNCAIKLVSETDGLVLVQAECYSSEESTRTIALFGDGVIIDTADVSFTQKGESRDMVFDLNGEQPKIITAKVITEDILEEDNSYNLAIRTGNSKKALLVSKGNLFLEKAVSLINGVDLYKKSVNEIEGLSGYDIYIFDGCMPQQLPTDGQLWILDPPEDNGFIETKATTGVTDIEVNSNLFSEHAEKMDFSVNEAGIASVPVWGEKIISGKDGALVFAGELNDQKICVFSFDLHKSNLPLKKEFPIIVYNIMNYFVPDSATGVTQIFSGNRVNLNILPKAIGSSIVFPDGSETALKNGENYLDNTYQTGVYTLKQSLEDGIVDESNFAVNPVTQGESEMDKAESVGDNATKTKNIRTGKSIKNAIIALLLLVLCAEWWVNWRGN